MIHKRKKEIKNLLKEFGVKAEPINYSNMRDASFHLRQKGAKEKDILRVLEDSGIEKADALKVVTNIKKCPTTAMITKLVKDDKKAYSQQELTNQLTKKHIECNTGMVGARIASYRPKKNNPVAIVTVEGMSSSSWVKRERRIPGQSFIVRTQDPQHAIWLVLKHKHYDTRGYQNTKFRVRYINPKTKKVGYEIREAW